MQDMIHQMVQGIKNTCRSISCMLFQLKTLSIMGFRLLSQQNIKVEIRNIKKLEITLKKKLKFNIIV